MIWLLLKLLKITVLSTGYGINMTCNFIGKIKNYEHSDQIMLRKSCFGVDNNHQALIINFRNSVLCNDCWISMTNGIDEVNILGTEIVDKIKKSVPTVKMMVSESGSVYFFTPNKKLRVSDHYGVQWNTMPKFYYSELLIFGEYRTVNGVNNRYVTRKPSKADIENAIEFLLNIKSEKSGEKFYLKGKKITVKRNRHLK